MFGSQWTAFVLTLPLLGAFSGANASHLSGGDIRYTHLGGNSYRIEVLLYTKSTDWQKRLPHNSSPYTSTIVFLVRKGNPKGIKDWNDLVKADVSIITPNPKTSGGARWNYLAAWAYALEQPGGNEAKAKEFVGQVFRNVKVLDSGARGSTTTFVERGNGDVLMSRENQAYLSLKELGDKFESDTPSLSILAEPPVSVVDKTVGKRGTRKVAQAYLEFLYSPEGQEIAAKNFYRPQDAKVAAKYAKQFAKIRLVTIDNSFGGWRNERIISPDNFLFLIINSTKRDFTVCFIPLFNHHPGFTGYREHIPDNRAELYRKMVAGFFDQDLVFLYQK